MKKHAWFVWSMNILALGIVGSLSVNIGFVAHALISPIFETVPALSIIVAVLFGLLIGGGEFGLFLKSETALRAIKEYADYTKEKPLPRYIALMALNLLFFGIEVAGLCYRIPLLNDKGVGWLIAIGVLLAAAPPIIGIVLFPLLDPPADMVEDMEADRFERSHVQELYSQLHSLPLALQHQAYNGDVDGALAGYLEEQKQIAEEKDARYSQRREHLKSRRLLTNGMRNLNLLEQPKNETEEPKQANFTKAPR